MGSSNNYLERLTARPLQNFLKAIVVAGVVSFAIYMVYALYHTGQLYPEPSQELVAPISLALGTAVSFGGSLVAIVLASYAVRLQSRQDEREVVTTQIELTNTIENGVLPLARLQKSIQKLITASITLSGLTNQHDLSKFFQAKSEGRIKDIEDDPEFQSFSQDIEFFIDLITERLTNFQASLNDLSAAKASSALTAKIMNDLYKNETWRAGPNDDSPIDFLNLGFIADLQDQKIQLIKRKTLEKERVEKISFVLDRMQLASRSRSRQGDPLKGEILGLLTVGYMVTQPVLTQDMKGEPQEPTFLDLIFSFVRLCSQDAITKSIREFFDPSGGDPYVDRSLEKIEALVENSVNEVIQLYEAQQPKLVIT